MNELMNELMQFLPLCKQVKTEATNYSGIIVCQTCEWKTKPVTPPNLRINSGSDWKFTYVI